MTAGDALIDGNKRLGWVAVRLFYRLNERDLRAPIEGAFGLVAAIADGSLRDVPAVTARARGMVIGTRRRMLTNTRSNHTQSALA